MTHNEWALRTYCSSHNTYKVSIHMRSSIVATLARQARVPLRRAVLARGLATDVSEPAVLDQELEYFAVKKQVPVSLKTLMETGMGNRLDLLHTQRTLDATAMQKVLIQVGSFIHRELPVRLAHRVKELEGIPVLRDSRSVKQVCNWYKQSFQELRESPAPTSVEKEAQFAVLIRKIYERHAPTLITMARGAYEIRAQLNKDVVSFAEHNEIQGFLDKFYISRIGIRMLLGQYLSLQEPAISDDYVGLINLKTSVAEVANAAIEDAAYMCMRQHGDAPNVSIHGRTDLTFAYVPSHLHYILLELLKNSMRATCEFHGVDNLPPIRIIIADGEANEDVVIKVSDEGGGIKRSFMPRIWSYLFTTADPTVVEGFVNADAPDFDTASPLAGLGYGLPISRSYARYFGGDLNVMSMEGYGTDAFVYLNRLGDRDEPLP